MAQPTVEQAFGKRLSQERRLLQVREERDVENQDVAKALGVDPATVGRWFNGESIPRGETLAQLARYFGVTVSWLHYGEGTREATPLTPRESNEKDAPPPIVAKPVTSRDGVRRRKHGGGR